MAHVHKEKYHKALQMRFLEGTVLEVTFEDGLVKSFDISSKFDDCPELKALEDRKFFESGQLFSFYIYWTDLVDIETEEIYDAGITVRKDDPYLKGNAGTAVSFARKARNLSQTALAEKAGLDQSDLSKIERGTANPSVKTLQKIAKALDCELVISFKSIDPNDPLFYPELEENGFVIR